MWGTTEVTGRPTGKSSLSLPSVRLGPYLTPAGSQRQLFFQHHHHLSLPTHSLPPLHTKSRDTPRFAPRLGGILLSVRSLHLFAPTTPIPAATRGFSLRAKVVVRHDGRRSKRIPGHAGERFRAPPLTFRDTCVCDCARRRYWAQFYANAQSADDSGSSRASRSPSSRRRRWASSTTG